MLWFSHLGVIFALWIFRRCFKIARSYGIPLTLPNNDCAVHPTNAGDSSNISFISLSGFEVVFSSMLIIRQGSVVPTQGLWGEGKGWRVGERLTSSLWSLVRWMDSPLESPLERGCCWRARLLFGSSVSKAFSSCAFAFPRDTSLCYLIFRPNEGHEQLPFLACAAVRTLSVSVSTCKALPLWHQPGSTKVLLASPAPTSCQVVSWDLNPVQI